MYQLIFRRRFRIMSGPVVCPLLPLHSVTTTTSPTATICLAISVTRTLSRHYTFIGRGWLQICARMGVCKPPMKWTTIFFYPNGKSLCWWWIQGIPRLHAGVPKIVRSWKASMILIPTQNQSTPQLNFTLPLAVLDETTILIIFRNPSTKRAPPYKLELATSYSVSRLTRLTRTM